MRLPNQSKSQIRSMFQQRESKLSRVFASQTILIPGYSPDFKPRGPVLVGVCYAVCVGKGGEPRKCLRSCTTFAAPLPDPS